MTAYLYWNQELSSYSLAAPSDAAAAEAAPAVAEKPAAVAPVAAPAEKAPEAKTKEEKPEKQDKVKVAKKIVKDMEKWAKQLNQKKEMGNMVSIAQPLIPKCEEIAVATKAAAPISSGYADVGFSILENRETRAKPEPAQVKTLTAFVDSDPETEQPPSAAESLVNFENLTCLLCKRAFQSLDILNKHLKLSNLHKENLAKYTAQQKLENNSTTYRDRAKERRQKYVESEPPPANKTRERFEQELQKQTTQLQRKASENLAAMPIGTSNLGNRMLQKMGWTEGQGLGRSNQGRTNIIEVSAHFAAH